MKNKMDEKNGERRWKRGRWKRMEGRAAMNTLPDRGGKEAGGGPLAPLSQEEEEEAQGRKETDKEMKVGR